MTTPARQTRTSVKSLEVISSGPDPTFIYPASYAETEPFTKPHTVTVLLLGVAFIVYGVWIRSEAEDADNVKMYVDLYSQVTLLFTGPLTSVAGHGSWHRIWGTSCHV